LRGLWLASVPVAMRHRERVELVQRLLPPPGVDLTLLVRNDDLIAGFMEQASPYMHPQFECVADWGGDRAVYRGLDGLRAMFLDWLTPWTRYRSEPEDIKDLGDHVLVLVRDFGRRADTELEVQVRGASIWRFREQKIVRAEFYARRGDALEAVGLSE
jgi:ketosteroid isomerase-like protein